MALDVQLVSPERILYSGTAQMVVCRTVSGGDIAFLTGHVSFIGAVAIHSVRVQHPSGDVETFAVHGGFVEVSNDRVTILSDVAELATQIDVGRAERANDAAETRLREAPDDEDALAASQRAKVRLEVARGAA